MLYHTVLLYKDGIELQQFKGHFTDCYNYVMRKSEETAIRAQQIKGGNLNNHFGNALARYSIVASIGYSETIHTTPEGETNETGTALHN